MNTHNEDLYNKINDLRDTFSNKRCELTALEKDIKNIHEEMLDLKRAYCVEWFTKNRTNIYQTTGLYTLYGCRVEKVKDSVTKIEPRIKTEYNINGFYELITYGHTDKIYKIEVDDIMDVVDNFAHRLIRRV